MYTGTVWCHEKFAIELNVSRNDFSELTFVNLGHGFKNAGSVLFDIGVACDKDF